MAEAEAALAAVLLVTPLGRVGGPTIRNRIGHNLEAGKGVARPNILTFRGLGGKVEVGGVEAEDVVEGVELERLELANPSWFHKLSLVRQGSQSNSLDG